MMKVEACFPDGRMQSPDDRASLARTGAPRGEWGEGQLLLPELHCRRLCNIGRHSGLALRHLTVMQQEEC